MTSRNTSAIPYPGDSVCPTPRQFLATYKSSYKYWTSLISSVRQNPSIPSIIASLLDLLKRIPAFKAQHSHKFRILDGPCPQIQFALEWVTAIDPTCDQPIKRTYHYQKLAIPQPVMYSLVPSPRAFECWPYLRDKEYGHLSYLVLGWAFILSSRWVETLKDSGEEVFLCQSEEINGLNFWDVVACHPWQAGVVRGGKVFKAPWSLTNHDLISSYDFLACVPVLLYLPTISVKSYYVSANSSSAFTFFAGSCRSEGIVEECFAALTIALMLPEYNEVELPNLGAPPTPARTMGNPDDFYSVLFDCLDNCITLSCLCGGIESLLCSQFFDASIPCNLVGAYLLGISRAIESIQSDMNIFAALMAQRKPMLSPLWQAAIWTGRSKSVLASVMGGLPPINLAIASWTDTIQSFLQVEYESVSDLSSSLSRACEFNCAYMVSPNIVEPFTPSPPFGQTALANTNLDVRAHISHSHKLRWCRTYWLLAEGKEILAQPYSDFAHRPSIYLPPMAQMACTEAFDME